MVEEVYTDKESQFIARFKKKYPYAFKLFQQGDPAMIGWIFRNFDDLTKDVKPKKKKSED